MKLSIIIPVYNEKNTVLEIIRRVEKAKLPLGWEKEITIVDDGSNDGTKEKLGTIKKNKIIFHTANSGKGAAIRTGIENATGDIILIQDADLEYNPKEYKKLLKPLLSGPADVVYGQRNIKFDPTNFQFILHYFGNKLLTLITKILYFTKINDMETGYKVFKQAAIKQIKIESNRFDFEPEITAKTVRAGWKIENVPVSFNPRTAKMGKKINWKDGLVALYVLLRLRFFKNRY